jgi:hypothetical protein
MKIELCDWCGELVNSGEGATIKVWEHFLNKEGIKGKELWGKSYRICIGCMKEIKQKINGVTT